VKVVEPKYNRLAQRNKLSEDEIVVDLQISNDYSCRGIDVTLGVMEFQVATPIGTGAARTSLTKLSDTLQPQFHSMKPAEIREIAATRKAYRGLGKDPGRYRPSSEALLRRIASGKPLPHINNVVDAGNVISIENFLALGAYNASKIVGSVVFRRAEDGETAEAIGRGKMNFEHLPVFSDEQGPFGSPTSDTERTMVSVDAKEIFMVLIGFEKDEKMNARLVLACDSVKTLCAAEHLSMRVVQNW
jgi:DNA/RNA-binding domain of Phe-tRNA-synthetase-like protein